MANETYRFNPHKLRKKDLVDLMTNYCKHGHTYLEHPKCYYEEQPDFEITERIGYLDIENSNLSAPYGYVISWAIMDQSGKVFGDAITPDEIFRESGSDPDGEVMIDNRVLRSFSKQTDEFDKIVVYWGKNRRHDIPFLRHRCLKLGIPFPVYGTVHCIDLYDQVKNLLKMGWSKNSLNLVCKEFGIPAKQTHCPASYWVKACSGNQKAIDAIFQHNKEDVICLQPLHEMLDPFVRRMRTSI